MTDDGPSLQFLAHFEKKLLFFCTLVFLGSIGAIGLNLVVKLENQQSFQQRQRVGIVASINNELKIKNADGPSWKKAQSREILYAFDSLMTEADAGALIVLDDGSELKLSSDSLIVLNKMGQQTELEVKQGEIAGKTGSLLNLAVYDQGQKIQMDVKDVNFDLMAKENMPLDFKVMRGKVRIFNGQDAVDLGPNQSWQLKDKKIDTKTQEIVLLSPGDKQTWEAGGQVDFRWQGPQEMDKFYFELSPSADFKNLLLQQEVEKNHFSYRLNQEGIFFWRIKGGQEQISDIRTIILEKMEKPRPLVPVLEEIKDNARLKLVHFAWDGPYERYNFYLKHSPNAVKNILSQSVSQKTISLKLSKGIYYWQVEGVGKEGLRSASEIKIATVDDDSYLIRLLAPAANWKYFYEELNNDLTLIWDLKKSLRVDNYELIIATDRDLNNKVFQQKKINSTSWHWTEVVPGNYFWQVIGSAPGGKISSEIGHFQIYLKKELIPKINTREVNLKL